MLPAEITTETVRETSDLVDATTDLLDALDDTEVMSRYIDEVINRLAVAHNLTDEQTEELTERITWRLELLPR